MALSCNESSLTDDGPNGAFAPRRKSMGSKSNQGNKKKRERGKVKYPKYILETFGPSSVKELSLQLKAIENKEHNIVEFLVKPQSERVLFY